MSGDVIAGCMAIAAVAYAAAVLRPRIDRLDDRSQGAREDVGALTDVFNRAADRQDVFRESVSGWWATVEERMDKQTRNQILTATRLQETQEGCRMLREEVSALVRALDQTTHLLEPAHPELTRARRVWIEEGDGRRKQYIAEVGARIDQKFNTPEGKAAMTAILRADALNQTLSADEWKARQLPEGAIGEWIMGHEKLRILAGGEPNMLRTAQAALNIGIQVLMTAGEEDARHNLGLTSFPHVNTAELEAIRRRPIESRTPRPQACEEYEVPRG
jgi:hypothetical protein